MQANNNTLGTNIELAVAKLKAGKLVSFPTETVYGLGADATNLHAVKSVFATKGRPTDHPLIVHILNAGMLDFWAKNIPTTARLLVSQFWPGPLTLILSKQDHVFPEITGGQDTIALRVPSHPMALKLLYNFKGLVGPSANKYGKVSPTCAEHVWEDLQDNIDVASRENYIYPNSNIQNVQKNQSNTCDPLVQNSQISKVDYSENNLSQAQIDNKTNKSSPQQELASKYNPTKNLGYILDGGACDVGIESTIVDCTGNTPKVVRQGLISEQQIKKFLEQQEEVISKDNIDFASKKNKINLSKILNNKSKFVEHIKIPGCKESHYAPNTPLFLMNLDEIQVELKAVVNSDSSCAILAFNYKEFIKTIKDLYSKYNVISNNSNLTKKNIKNLENLHNQNYNNIFNLDSDLFLIEANKEPLEYAKNLYINLRILDKLGVEKIIIEQPESKGLWVAILDRLQRAAFS